MHYFFFKNYTGKKTIFGEGFCFYCKKQNVLVCREPLSYIFSIILISKSDLDLNQVFHLPYHTKGNYFS